MILDKNSKSDYRRFIFLNNIYDQIIIIVMKEKLSEISQSLYQNLRHN